MKDGSRRPLVGMRVKLPGELGEADVFCVHLDHLEYFPSCPGASTLSPPEHTNAGKPDEWRSWRRSSRT